MQEEEILHPKNLSRASLDCGIANRSALEPENIVKVRIRNIFEREEKMAFTHHILTNQSLILVAS